MKQEWKPDEMRANAEEIRSAVMPKSVTPEMVGTTLLGLVNAVGEVVDVLGEIPREHVKVKVRGYDGEGGEIVGSGATVFVDQWCIGGFPSNSIPRSEIIANADGEIEFDVPFGYKYAVFSKFEGLGASFQWVFEASQEKREIDLWNQPIGIYAQWLVGFYKDDSDDYLYLPAVKTHGDDTPFEDPDSVLSPAPDGFVPDENYFVGVLVSTSETSFIIPENNDGSSMPDERLMGAGSRNMRGLVPFLPAINTHTEEGKYQGNSKEASSRAKADMDGNMNTAKILDFCKSAPAADWVSESDCWWEEQRWLPSAGQLYLIYLNRAAIDSILKGRRLTKHLVSTLNRYYWSSTQFDESSSWIVCYDGQLAVYDRVSTHYVRAVSAFYFELQA